MQAKHVVVIAGLVTALVYMSCMAPGAFWRDSLEFCLIGHQLDIGHPAGSPTFSLASKTLSFLPLGSLAWRANLLSVLSALAAVLLLWLAAARWIRLLKLGEGEAVWAFGGCAAMAFAFSRSFWAWSEVAEVYAGQMALLAVLLYLAADAMSKEYDARTTALIGFVLGLSCGVHMAQILYAPAFALALLVGPRFHVRWRGLALMIAFFLLGFAVFAYLPVRSLTQPVYDYGNPETPAALLAHITGRQYAGIIHHFPWQRIWYNASLLPGHIVRELNPLLALAALIGLVVLGRREKRGLVLFVLIIAGHLYLYVKDWWRPFGYITVFLLFALLGALGLAWLWNRLVITREEARAKSVTVWLALLAMAMAVWGLAFHFDYCNRSAHRLADEHGRAILASLPQGAVLVGNRDHLAYNTFYQQLIERRRPDISFVHRAWLPFPHDLQRRFPDWDFADYHPHELGSAQRLLLANAGEGGAFWDFGWERTPWIDSAKILPHALVSRLTDQVWDGSPIASDERLWEKYFNPIMDNPLVAPKGFDFTAQEVYANVFHLRAKVHADAARWEQAETEQKRAVDVYPENASHRASLALTLMAQEKYAEAKKQLDRALELDPLCAHCRQAMGQLRLLLGDQGGALQEYRQAYRLDKGSVPVAIELSRLLLRRRQFEPVPGILETALPNANQREQKFRLHLYAAQAYLGLSDCERAKPHLREIAKIHPESQLVRNLLEICALSPTGDL